MLVPILLGLKSHRVTPRVHLENRHQCFVPQLRNPRPGFQHFLYEAAQKPVILLSQGASNRSRILDTLVTSVEAAAHMTSYRNCLVSREDNPVPIAFNEKVR